MAKDWQRAADPHNSRRPEPRRPRQDHPAKEPVRAEPVKTGLRRARGDVFQADRTAIAKVVDQSQEPVEIDFTGTGFVAVGRIGDLDVPDPVAQSPERAGEVAGYDTGVIGIELPLPVLRTVAVKPAA